jgi:hypothetical protein
MRAEIPQDIPPLKYFKSENVRAVIDAVLAIKYQECLYPYPCSLFCISECEVFNLFLVLFCQPYCNVIELFAQI